MYKQYEYFSIHANISADRNEVNKYLNFVAKQGWRLVAVDNGIAYFEREHVANGNADVIEFPKPTNGNMVLMEAAASSDTKFKH